VSIKELRAFTLASGQLPCSDGKQPTQLKKNSHRVALGGFYGDSDFAD